MFPPEKVSKNEMSHLSLENVLLLIQSRGISAFMSDNISALYVHSDPPKPSEREGGREEAALSELVTASTSDGSYFFTASPREIALVQFSEPGRYDRFVRPPSHLLTSTPRTTKRRKREDRKDEVEIGDRFACARPCRSPSFSFPETEFPE